MALRYVLQAGHQGNNKNRAEGVTQNGLSVQDVFRQHHYRVINPIMNSDGTQIPDGQPPAPGLYTLFGALGNSPIFVQITFFADADPIDEAGEERPEVYRGPDGDASDADSDDGGWNAADHAYFRGYNRE